MSPIAYFCVVSIAALVLGTVRLKRSSELGFSGRALNTLRGIDGERAEWTSSGRVERRDAR